jgi:putative ABC transport system permease protein
MRQRQWRTAAALAWADFRHEWRVSLCLVLALAAVLGPLLALFGLKSGIVTTMRERLRADPVNREIVLRGHHALDAQWFAALGAREDVAFVVPRTRWLSASMTLEVPGGVTLPDVDMVPTAEGDPLVPAAVPPPTGLGDVLLTHTAAQKLNVEAGARLEGVIARRLAGVQEAIRVPLVVRGVLPETAFGRDAVFVSLPLLAASEDYRDGLAVPALGVAEGEPARGERRVFASARLHARGLDDVAPLAEHLRRQGIEVVTRAREIETVQRIDRVLSSIFVALAALGVAGCLASLATSLWANVDRKRREIALLRLVGLRSAPVVSFPVVQAMLVAAGGIVLAGAAYSVLAGFFNRAFAGQLAREELVCKLAPADALAAAGLTVLLALVASVVGGYRALRIDPAESLRET